MSSFSTYGCCFSRTHRMFCSGMESSTQLRCPMDMVNMGKMIFLSEKQVWLRDHVLQDLE